jgi:hypothetical protein
MLIGALDNRHILLFRDNTPKKELQGFLIIHNFLQLIENQSVKVIQGEFFVVKPDYRYPSNPILTPIT